MRNEWEESARDGGIDFFTRTDDNRREPKWDCEWRNPKMDLY